LPGVDNVVHGFEEQEEKLLPGGRPRYV
jgi:hypothetical protein